MTNANEKVIQLKHLGAAMSSIAAKTDTRFVKKEGFDDAVRTIAAEELATQLIPENAKESMDTLTEIATWIQSHPDDASAMNTAIQALKTKLTLGTKNVGGETKEYDTVKEYVEAQITSIDTSIFVEKAEGKDLSTNDFTDEYKSKLDGLQFAEESEIGAMIEEIWNAIA